jgi:hypothetical protein
VATRVAEIERRLAHVTVHLAPTLPDDAQVTRDGEPFDRRLVDTGIPANPRPTTFTVSAPGFADRAFHVTLADGKSAEVTLDVGEPSTNPAATGGESSGPNVKPIPWRTVGFVTVGLGLPSLALGGVMGALAINEASIVKSHCQIPAYTCDAQGVSAGSSGQAFAVTSTAAFVIGAALSATGLALVLVNGKPKTERATLTIVPVVGASSGGAFTTLSF